MTMPVVQVRCMGMVVGQIRMLVSMDVICLGRHSFRMTMCMMFILVDMGQPMRVWHSRRPSSAGCTAMRWHTVAGPVPPPPIASFVFNCDTSRDSRFASAWSFSIADGAVIHSFSHIVHSSIGKNASVGPFARMWHLYDAALTPANFRLVQTSGPYDIYARLRPD